jgi:hypothetical protein
LVEGSSREVIFGRNMNQAAAWQISGMREVEAESGLPWWKWLIDNGVEQPLWIDGNLLKEFCSS